MNQPARHLRRPESAPRPAPEVPRHLRVVDRRERTPAQRQRRARLFLVGGIGMAVTVMFALVYLHVVLAQRQIQLDRMTTVAATRQSQYQALRLRVAQLESPQHIISTAEGRLGMRQPGAVTYLPPPAAATLPVAGRSTTGSGSGASARPLTTAAPAGDADWPRIKAALASRP